VRDFVDTIARRLSEGVNVKQALREWAVGDSTKEEVINEAASNGKSLNKTPIGTVDFMGDTVKVCTLNGQYTRSPNGMNVIEFTMGGNWYGGTRKGTYWPVCAEDEIVLHELMPPVDLLATLVHELIERYIIKIVLGSTKDSTEEEWSDNYDEAHSKYAEPCERIARVILESEEWSKRFAA
jgi:hypothetical protein